MPRIPFLLLRPIMPDETDDIKITKKNHSEFHHLAAGALKQITNHSNPPMDNIKLKRSYIMFLFTVLFWTPPLIPIELRTIISGLEKEYFRKKLSSHSKSGIMILYCPKVVCFFSVAANALLSCQQ